MPASISIASTTDVHSSTDDTIDEPPLLDDPGYLGSPVRNGGRVRRTNTGHNSLSMAHGVFSENCKTGRTENGVLQKYQKSAGKGQVLYKKHRKIPEAPTNVCVTPCGRKGETLAVSWDPAKYVGSLA